MQASSDVRVHLWRSSCSRATASPTPPCSREIVDAAGVTKGAMYHRSKDDLLFGIYEHLLTLQGDHPRRSSPHAIQRRRTRLRVRSSA
jgi:hypothetical protein